MGIYDRDYYRREGPSFLGSFAERGYVCKWLIGINVIAFILQYVSEHGTFSGIPVFGNFTQSFWLSVDGVRQGELWRLLTYAFLHDTGNILHILFNMLCLWWFGSEMENVYGRAEFLTIYLVCAVVAGAAFVLTYYVRLSDGMFALGASGAVTAMMVLYALHYPKRTVLLFFVLPVPIWLAVILFIGLDMYGFLSAENTRRIAFSAHLAGAGFALLYYKAQFRFTDLLAGLQNWRRRRFRPRLRLYDNEEEQSAPVHAGHHVNDLDEQLEAKMDAVLQKVKDHGIDSLTPGERQILLRASEAYRRRRE